VLAQVAEFVQLGVVGAADDTRIGGDSGRLVGDGALEPFADVGELVDFVVQAAQEIAATFEWSGDEILQHRNLRERLAQRDQFAGCREP